MSNLQKKEVLIGELLVADLMIALEKQIENMLNQPWEKIKAEIHSHANDLIKQNMNLVTDDKSQQWLLFSATVLAAYKKLQAITGDRQKIFSVLYNSMSQPFKDNLINYIAERFDISQDFPHKAFEQVSLNFKKRGEERFGNSFIYELEEQDSSHISFNIKKCFFNDFFHSNETPELIPVLCSLDNLWAEELEKPSYKVHFECPATLGKGNNMCKFQFFKKV